MAVGEVSRQYYVPFKIFKNLSNAIYLNFNRFKIKSNYAFGTKGNEKFNIPPNANVEYTIKLNDCEKVMDDWRFTKEERFEHAKIYKEKGTKYFKKENYSLAIKMYKKSVNILTDENCKFQFFFINEVKETTEFI